MTPIRLPKETLCYFGTRDDPRGRTHVGVKFWTASNQLTLIAHMLARRLPAAECARIIDGEHPDQAPAAANAAENLRLSGILVDLEAAILGRVVPETVAAIRADEAEFVVEFTNQAEARQ